MPGSSAVSPPRMAQPAARQTSAAPSISSATCSTVDRVGGDVVEEEERLGAGRENVVDAVGGEVGAAPAQPPTAPAEHELRADRVGRRSEQSSLVDGEKAREGAERPDHPWCPCRRDGVLQALHDRVGSRERDPCGRIGLLPGFHASRLPRDDEARARTTAVSDTDCCQGRVVPTVRRFAHSERPSRCGENLHETCPTRRARAAQTSQACLTPPER